MRRDFNYSVIYRLAGETWTFTSCKHFSSSATAILFFVTEFGHEPEVMFTVKYRRRYIISTINQ